MKAFSLFQIPKKDIHIYNKNIVSSSVDYKRFSFSDKSLFSKILQKYFFWFSFLDSDNSNTKYFDYWTLSRVPSPRWKAFIFFINLVWFPPIPIIYIEEYSNWFKNSVGRVDFYGAFFHFYNTIKDLPICSFFLELEELSLDNTIRCTRTDIAFDFSIPFPHDWVDYILPSDNSQRSVYAYYYKNKLNSVSYLTKKNSWYGVRMYNKNLDITQKWKDFWYDIKYDNLTRIEFEFYPPYSHEFSSHQLKSFISKKLLWTDIISLWLKYIPQKPFQIENAYNHFARYAKNHWVTIDYLIDELHKYLLTLK